jgi:hypothetical protein
VAHTTLLNDDLLRHLMAVGQVDIVVGVPTLNNAETIAATVRTADAGLAKHFPRARTVIITADGGSRDGTPEIVEELSSGGGGRLARGLRTRHQISASYRGIASKAGAVRLIFAAADLLQARAVTVLDTEVTSLAPEWIARLAGPVSSKSFDFVAPLYQRHPFDGPLLSQLVRPVIRAAYGRQVDEPLIGEFGCSGRFATHCLAQQVFWDSSANPDGIELWLSGAALSGEFQACQAFLGPRSLSPRQPRPGLRDVFPSVVGSLFASLDRQADAWLSRQASDRLPVIGEEADWAEDAPPLDPARLGQSFVQDVRDLGPILKSIVAADTFAKLGAIADTTGAETLPFPDEVWIATVYDFLAAYHAGVMDRAHIAQALMPLYLGRVASFLMQHRASGSRAVEQDLEQLSRQFERAKPYLIERWKRST